MEIRIKEERKNERELKNLCHFSIVYEIEGKITTLFE